MALLYTLYEARGMCMYGYIMTVRRGGAAALDERVRERGVHGAAGAPLNYII